MNSPLIAEKAFLYSLWSGKFRVFEGTLQDSGRHFYPTGLFVSKTKHFVCHKDPRVVYNAVVWLPEKDDNLARNILIDYEEKAVDLLKEKIDNHHVKMSILLEDPE